MAGDTKERILEVSLELFAQSGYLGTSMSDIAHQLGITKSALYKHYTGKQEILDSIVEKMSKTDYEQAEKYEMPETEPDGFDSAYIKTSIEKIVDYSVAQFDYWTKDKFAADFRKMLVLEQYRDPQFGQLYHNYLAAGPTEYMAAIFRRFCDSDSSAMQLALEFYGPMFLLYSLYDAADDKESVDRMLRTHIDRFLKKIGSGHGK